MNLSNHRKIRVRFYVKMVFSISIIIIINGCMSMGMKLGKNMKSHHMMTGYTDKTQLVNTDQILDQMIIEAVSDLSSKDLAIGSIAVWKIKSRTAGLNVETARRKLITHLVNLDRFKVLSRERLKEILEEQSLSLSGAIDEKRAVEIGKLIGIEGFIDGYASIDNNRIVLDLSLIETKSGVIVWAKIVEREVPDE